jgi:transposase InsO family protein
MTAHVGTRQTYGPERQHAELACRGIHVGLHRIKQLRNQLGLRCKRKRRYQVTTDSRQSLPLAPNQQQQRQVTVTITCFPPGRSPTACDGRAAAPRITLHRGSPLNNRGFVSKQSEPPLCMSSFVTRGKCDFQSCETF